MLKFTHLICMLTCAIALAVCSQATAANFVGTGGDDVIVVDAQNQRVIINGQISPIPAGQDLTVDGGGGNDRCSYLGAVNTLERARFSAGQLRVVSALTTVTCVNCENLQARCNPEDLAIMIDSPAAETLVVMPSFTSLDNSSYTYEARGFHRLTVISQDFDDDDVAMVFSKAFRRLVASEDSFSLLKRSTAMNHYVEGFERVDTTDIEDFVFVDTAEADLIRIRRNLIIWRVPNYTFRHWGTAKQITVVGAQTSPDAPFDEADIKLPCTPGATLTHFEAGDSTLAYTNYQDAVVSISINRFEKPRFEILPSDCSEPAFAKITSEHCRSEVLTDADAKVYQLRTPRGFQLSASQGSGPDLIGFNKIDHLDKCIRPGDQKITMLDSSGDDLVEMGFDSQYEDLGDRYNDVARFKSQDFEVSVFGQPIVYAFSDRGGDDHAAVEGSVTLRPGRITRTEGVGTVIGFGSVTAEGGADSNLKLHATSRPTQNDPFTEAVVTPGGLRAVDALGSVVQANGYGQYFITGANYWDPDSRTRPATIRDYGPGAGKLRVIYDNQDDPSLRSVRNAVMSESVRYDRNRRVVRFFSVGWTYETNSAEVFISRFENYLLPEQAEITGISAIPVLNAPDGYPVIQLPLPDDLDPHN